MPSWRRARDGVPRCGQHGGSATADRARKTPVDRDVTSASRPATVDRGARRRSRCDPASARNSRVPTSTRSLADDAPRCPRRADASRRAALERPARGRARQRRSAFAIGCSLASSAEAASCERRVVGRRVRRASACSAVSVPVLSRHATSIVLATSSAGPPRNKMPSSAAARGADRDRRRRRQPERARTRDHEHRDHALDRGRRAGARDASQPTNVTGGDREHDRHEDAPTRDRRAARSAACSPCASSTARAIRASAVSAPARATRTTSAPCGSACRRRPARRRSCRPASSRRSAAIRRRRTAPRSPCRRRRFARRAGRRSCRPATSSLAATSSSSPRRYASPEA